MGAALRRHTFVVACSIEIPVHVNTLKHLNPAAHTEIYIVAERAKITSVADRQTVLIYFRESPVLENMCQHEACSTEAKLLQGGHVMN